jgi:hypothetical protein
VWEGGAQVGGDRGLADAAFEIENGIDRRASLFRIEDPELGRRGFYFFCPGPSVRRDRLMSVVEKVPYCDRNPALLGST